MGCKNSTRGLAIKIPVRQVIGQACCMVHMSVGQQNMIDGDDLVRGLADIEAHIQLRYGDYGFFAGDRISDHVEVVNLDFR